MSQIWDIDLISATGTSPATDITRIVDGFNALKSTFSGAAEPAAADQVPYMLWADTTNGVLKIRNAGNTAWLTLGSIANAFGSLCTLTTASYIKIPTFDGTVMRSLILQWATSAVIGANASVDITLPITFPTAGLLGVATHTNATGAVAYPCNVMQFPNTSTIRIYNGGAASAQFNFFAIGY